ncbi:crk-like protein isoform X2 [Lissotriton helveticus]
MSGRDHADFSEDLICSICLELFCKPVILECGHNFCGDCIRQVWQGKKVFSCPECRQEFAHQKFIANRVLGNLAEKAQSWPAVQRAEEARQSRCTQQHSEEESIPEVDTKEAEQASFNFGDRSEWYFGPVDRAETEALLMGQPPGTFLVRDSATCPGDYVLSVSENSKVRHYIIHSLPAKLTMGPKEFPNFPTLLDFYTAHYLDTATLKEPIFKALSRCADRATPTDGMDALWVLALYDFQDLEEDNLPFKVGEVLKVLKQSQKYWWTAQNREGKQGLIPVPYVRKIY